MSHWRPAREGDCLPSWKCSIAIAAPEGSQSRMPKDMTVTVLLALEDLATMLTRDGGTRGGLHVRGVLLWSHRDRYKSAISINAALMANCQRMCAVKNESLGTEKKLQGDSGRTSRATKVQYTNLANLANEWTPLRCSKLCGVDPCLCYTLSLDKMAEERHNLHTYSDWYTDQNGMVY